MATVKKYQHGELIATETIAGCACDVSNTIAKQMNDDGYIVETGYNCTEDYFWVIKNCGDNCIKVFS